MDGIIKQLFFTDTLISAHIKTRKIFKMIEKNETDYELVTTPFISIIEKISDKILLNIEIFINLFLIYEKEKMCTKQMSIEQIYKNFKYILIKLYKDNESVTALEEFLDQFYKIIYINLKLFDNVLKYDIVTAVSRFFEYLENNNSLFLIEETENESVCNICTETNKYNKLLCCKQNICKVCWIKGNFEKCPYCKLDFVKKININTNKIKNIYYKNE